MSPRDMPFERHSRISSTERRVPRNGEFAAEQFRVRYNPLVILIGPRLPLQHMLFLFQSNRDRSGVHAGSVVNQVVNPPFSEYIRSGNVMGGPGRTGAGGRLLARFFRCEPRAQ
jgi:hypothetical protein